MDTIFVSGMTERRTGKPKEEWCRGAPLYYSSVGKPKEEWYRGAPLYYSSVGKPKEEWCRGAPLYYSSVGKPKEEWCRGAPLYYSSVCVHINADLLVHVWRRGTYMSAIDSNHMIYMGTKFSHIPIIHVHNHQTYPSTVTG